MTCGELRPALLDCALGLAAAPPLAAHLAACAECRAELELLRQRAAAIDAELARGAAPPPALEERILERLAHRRRWPALAAAAALAAALLLFAILTRPAPEPRLTLSSWQSPTRSLLTPPLKAAAATPRLGETLFPISPKSKI